MSQNLCATFFFQLIHWEFNSMTLYSTIPLQEAAMGVDEPHAEVLHGASQERPSKVPQVLRRLRSVHPRGHRNNPRAGREGEWRGRGGGEGGYLTRHAGDSSLGWFTFCPRGTDKDFLTFLDWRIVFFTLHSLWLDNLTMTDQTWNSIVFPLGREG